jgi:hypothetical protein
MANFSPETQELQWELIEQGYMSELNDTGLSNADGYFGPATRRALALRERDLAEMPAPAKPWWESRRGKGMVKLAVGVIVGAVGLFWSGAENIDSAQVVDILYDAGPQIAAAIELVGLLLAALGIGQSAVGAVKAKGPIDPTLIARVRDKDIRIPTVQRKRGPFDPEI